MPLPAFFMANAFFLPVALWAYLTTMKRRDLIPYFRESQILEGSFYAGSTSTSIIQHSLEWRICIEKNLETNETLDEIYTLRERT